MALLPNRNLPSSHPTARLHSYGAPGSVNSGEVSSSDAAAVSLATSRAIFAALQGSDIPEYLRGYFNSMTAATMSQADIDNTLAYGAALKSMRDQVTETREPAAILADRIKTLDATLGISALNMDEFRQDMVAAMDAGRIDPSTIAAWQELNAAMMQSAEVAKAVAAKQHDLDLQLLDATGKASEATAARHADALAALDNDQQRATQNAIWAAQEATKAKEAAAAASAKVQEEAAARAQAASSQYADNQRVAQQQVIDGWKNVADSLIATVRKLRGDVLGTGERGFAAIQADYAVTLASAKSGNQSAASRLPELANALVDIGKVNTRTAEEQALLTARTMGSLRDVVTGIGKSLGVQIPAFAAGGDFAGGLRLVGENGPEIEATGPSRIFSTGQMRNLLSGDGGSLISELRALRTENRALLSALEARLLKLETFAQSTSRAVNGSPSAPMLVELVA